MIHVVDESGERKVPRENRAQCTRALGLAPFPAIPPPPAVPAATLHTHPGSGPESRSDAHCATIIGDWEEPSGESRITGVEIVRECGDTFRGIQTQVA